MPDSPLLPLTTASAFSGGEAFYTVQGGNDRKALSSQFYQYITTVSTFATGAGFPLTAVSDTNVNLNLAGLSSAALLQSVSITALWAGTLSSARLNANVVQTVTNDTNVTGAISSQNLTLGWLGTLSSGRLNANVVQTVTNDSNVTGTISSQNLALGWTGVLPSSRIGTIGSSQVTGTATIGPFNSSQVVFANSSNTVTGNDVFTWNNTANRLTVGASTPITIDFTQSALQVVSSGVNNWGQSWLQYDSVLGGGVELAFAHSRSSTAYGVTALTSTDNMVQFRVYGTDGTTYVPSARLEANVDSTVSSSIVPSRWAFYTQPTTGGSILERMRIDSGGHMIFNGTASVPLPDEMDLQIPGTTFPTAGAAFSRWANTATSVASLILAKSRGTVVSSNALLLQDDNVGRIYFRGNDGVNFWDGAFIQADVDGVAALNSMPFRLVFSTTPLGATFPVERMRIANNGNAGWNGYVAASEFNFIPSYQFNNSNTNVMINSWGNSAAGGSELYFNLSNGTTTPGSQGLVGNGNLVAFIDFTASDGIAFNSVARLLVDIDGPTSSGHVPGRYRFLTATTGNPVERLRIDNAGQMWVMASGVSSTPAGARGSINETVALYNHQGMGGL